jgi:ABC-type glycerol-3-phosphate transport system substrate-binding protein
MLPSAKERFTIDGKLYASPWDGEAYCRVYNKMIWDTIGETPAETWDEFEKQLEEIAAANPDKTAICFRHHDGHPDQHMFMQLWTDQPWIETEYGSVFDVKSEAYANYLQLIKRLYDKGLMTDDSWGKTLYDSWNTGNTATGISGSAWLQATAQKVFGQTNIIAMPNPVINPGDPPKTTGFTNCAMLFTGAAEPQEITDWLLWMFDPTVEKLANYSFFRGHLNYYHVPVYQSIYDNHLPNNPDWAWMNDILPQIKNSAAIPSNALTEIILPFMNAWEEKVVHGEATLDEAVEGMYGEFMDAAKNAG